MKQTKNLFWDWYQRHFTINVSIASFLFVLQLFHLYWLFTDQVLLKLVGQSYFFLDNFWGRMSIVFDYTEVPAIITTSLVYIHHLKKKFSYKYITYLIFLNLQWLHILWITDEFIVTHFTTHDVLVWSAVVAWVAILIDFLELPVIYDTVKQTIIEWRKK
jgi:hypothetical protein